MELAAALLASAVLAAMLFASRLPPGPEFFLPRRGGYALYRAAWRLFALPGGRAAFSVIVALLLLAAAAGFAVALRRAPKRRPASWPARLGLALGPLFAALLAARVVSRALDLIQLAWFPYGGMDAREPAAAFVLFALALVPAAAAARAWAAGRRRFASALFGALVALDVAGALLAARLGIGVTFAPPPARGSALFVVLTQDERGPGRDVYELSPDVFAGSEAVSYLRGIAAGPRGPRTIPALRALYEEETKRWDLAGLRDALLLGVEKGDPLARSLLLAQLSAAPPADEARAALGALADEGAWRIGPLGAAALARACAHLGDRDGAARWAAKSGMPAALLGLEDGGALKPGRVSGRLSVEGPARVALYRRSDLMAPYGLDASGLVAAAVPDARGRFAFSGLAAGRYYLAVAVPAGDGRRGEVSVSGSRGDVTIDPRRPSVDLPPLVLKFSPR